jgi:hypothetical protein
MPDERRDKFPSAFRRSERPAADYPARLINISSIEKKEVNRALLLTGPDRFAVSRINVRKWIGVKEIKGAGSRRGV